MRILPLILTAVVAAPALPAQAQQSPASAAAKGRIAPLSVQVVTGASPATAKAMTPKIAALIDRVLSVPPLHQPRGFSLTRSVSIDAPPAGLSPDHPHVAHATLIAQNIDLESGAKPDADGAYMGRLEGPTLRIGFNDLRDLYGNVSWPDGGHRTEVQHLPLIHTTQQGFPVLRVGIRNMILITKPGRLPYVHVTQADHLSGLIAESRASLAAYPNPKGQAILEAQIAALAALTPQQRAAPACVSSRLRVYLGDCSAPNPTYYVRLNPDYFDKGLPKSAIQMVTISTPAEGGHGHKILEPKLRAAAANLDLKAIQAALD